MRIVILACCFFLALAVPLGGQSGDDDPYSINVVRNALTSRLGGQKVVHSWSQKHLSRLGDGASVALLKILDQHDLIDPQTVRDFLPIIRDSFAEPGFIYLEADKSPKVTFFLLNYLGQNVSEVQAQHAIQQTVEYVKQKTHE